MAALAACALGLVDAPPAPAEDVPGFDRPGIGVASDTLPAGSFDWEYGLPDFDHSRAADAAIHEYAFDSHLRYGLTDRLELQFTLPVLLHRITGAGGRHTVGGLGDAVFGLKAALPAAGLASQLVGLVSVSAPTAAAGMGAGRPTYSAATQAAWKVGEGGSAGLYASATVVDGISAWLVSPSYSIALTDTLGAYVEAGQQFAAAGFPAQTLAGTGLTWMARPTVQLDVYVLKQVHGPGSDLSLGFGASKFLR